MLQPDHVQEIHLPINAQNLQFFRVGVIGDGRCLLHSILYLLNSNYPKLSLKEKFNTGQAFLKEIGDELDVDSWIQFSLGDSLISIIMTCRQILEPYHSESFLDTLFEKVSSIDDLSRIQLESESQTREFHNQVLPRIIEEHFRRYKKMLCHCKDLGFQEVHYLSSKYKINMLMIGPGNTLFSETRIDNNFPLTIILYNRDGNHWEPVLIKSHDKFYCTIPTRQLVLSDPTLD